MDVWAYKIARDFGFAPNPYFGYCTLACCKPHIRKRAEIGDLVVGCGSAKLKLMGRSIFAMRITETLSFQQYWDDPRFGRKRPLFTAGVAREFGDNIYHRDNDGAWVQEDSHHSMDDGAWNAHNAERDLSADRVLLSTDFVYWGRLAPLVPPHLRDHNGEDFFPNVRDYRRQYSDGLKQSVVDWFDAGPKGRLGRPLNWD
jgi:hypothetical protein